MAAYETRNRCQRFKCRAGRSRGVQLVTTSKLPLLHAVEEGRGEEVPSKRNLAVPLENPSPRASLQGENSPNRSLRLGPLNCSSRRESALTSPLLQMERTHVRCYKVHGEGVNFVGRDELHPVAGGKPSRPVGASRPRSGSAGVFH